MANKAIKYRIYPSAEQEALIAKTFGCVRFVYNQFLAFQEEQYAEKLPHLGKNAMNNVCNQILKDEYPWLREVDKFALTNSVFSLDDAYQRFFKQPGKCGHPKYKSKKNPYRSYTTNITNNNVAILDGYIKLPKLGTVKTKLHRLPPKEWLLKSATVSMTASGKWYCSVLFEYREKPVKLAIPTPETTLGLDYSSPHFYVASNSAVAEYDHYFREAEAKLTRAQRRLSRMQKGSNNYYKQKRRVACIHEEITNRRKDFCHKESRKIANSFNAVCIEDINLRSMAQCLNLGKATNDNGFGMFRTFLQYKLQEQGKQLIVIDKWLPSTKACHVCGTINNELTLKDRHWTCDGCGAFHNRDENAAINIRNQGLLQLELTMAV